MLLDMLYSVLKQNARAFEIMLLCDQYGNTFADIAKKFEISAQLSIFPIYPDLKTCQSWSSHYYVHYFLIGDISLSIWLHRRLSQKIA